ncbi:unnamed protein product [Chironomus riparius]|uniref:Uncharacterized protein n=1 Tax=Chironomus riparius TaxID=315576 RepID=A0A9N9S2N4_9DIPT|nr:unnamed protein product [Chironomus riparius]
MSQTKPCCFTGDNCEICNPPEDSKIEDIYTDREFNEIANQPRSSSPVLMWTHDTFDLLKLDSQDAFEELYRQSMQDDKNQFNCSEDFNSLFEDQNSKLTEEEASKDSEKNQNNLENP